MKKRLMKALTACIPVLLLPLLLSGCWERKELNELAFVLGVGLDKVEDGYMVSMQVVIPSSISSQSAGGSGGSGVPVVFYSFRVKTVYESLRKFNLVSSRSPYMGHIRVLVVGEELARQGVGETLDVFKRSREPRMDFFVMVARNTTAANVLKVLTPLDRLPANKLFNSLDKSYRISSRTIAVTLDEFIEDLIYEGTNPVLTGVEVEGDPETGAGKSNVERTNPDTRLRYKSVAIFKGDRLIGWMDGALTVGYNYVIDNVTKNTGNFKDKNGSVIVMEALEAKTRRKVKIINGEPHIYLSVEALCNVEEIEGPDKLDTESKIRELELKTQERIVERMETAVKIITENYNADIFGFGRSVYRKSPKVWSKLREQENYLAHLPVHYKATVTINRIGTIDNSFIDEIKE
ncbi:Ger(x)C family spore germination protein [Paenibacillus piscarius]|uniref:Ger(x)C family spore germination protein n=1 Tax=Paenibacillus piscarius TaxID=1089681 RepID=UPI001EE9667A|nr:Ger(x)C family spore germination protein [Paenibacillus piscarius]